jgi:hypothetical protein
MRRGSYELEAIWHSQDLLLRFEQWSVKPVMLLGRANFMPDVGKKGERGKRAEN